MKLVYCLTCRKIRLDVDEVKKASKEFNELNEEEQLHFLEKLKETEDLDDVFELQEIRKTQTKVCSTVPDELQGVVWFKMSDLEWGVIQTIINSPTLLALVDNYIDYPEECPECKAKLINQENAMKN